MIKNNILKTILVVVVIACFLLVSGCSKPDENAPRAQVIASDSSDIDTMKEGSHEDMQDRDENTMEDNGGSMDSSEQENMDSPTVPINKEASSFEFEGFGPGKSHLGIFESWQGTMHFENEEIKGIEGSIDPSSVKTDSTRLDDHLRSSDFFDVEMYPEMKFVSTELIDNTMTGDLTFRGVTKSISFPVNLTANSISTDFILDTSLFGMEYTGVNKEVRIAFTFSV